MNKQELAEEMCKLLKQNDVRKPISIPKQKFTISDETGNSRMFTVKQKDKRALYTQEDCKNMLDVLVVVLAEAVKKGDPIYIPKFGTLTAHYRAPRKVRLPGSRKWKDIPAHYVPKMDYAKAIRDAAKIYETYMNEVHPPEPEKPKRGRGRPKKVDLFAQETPVDAVENIAPPTDEVI